MSPLFILAAIVGQAPTPQSHYAAAPGPPQTLVLLQYAPPAVPTAPSVLVASPPLWDRFLESTGRWLTDRAAKHRHGRPAQLLTAQPVTVQVAPAPVPVTVAPSAAPQSESVPTPSNFQPAPPAVLIPDPSGPLTPRRLFGG